MKRLLTILSLLIALQAHGQFCSYTFHAPISMTGVTTPTLISGDSITSISLTNCSNIHIFKCKVANNTSGAGLAINLSNCTNITIDSCFITNVNQGIYTHNCVSIKVNNNYFLNIIGSSTTTWHPIQFDTNTGGGQQIMNNKIEEIGVPYTHDQISVFGCTGAVGDSILITGNTIRGGQTVLNMAGNNGACGIGVDIGTTYCVVRNNKLINPGYAGIQIIGNGIDKIAVDHNYIYADGSGVALVGLSFQVSTAFTSCHVGTNILNWTKASGGIFNTFASPTNPSDWSTNTPQTTANPAANSTMIPNPQVTPCAVPPNITYTSPNIFSVGQSVTLNPTNTGGAATSWTCSPTLPVSLSINSGTGVITGTLTATASVATYTVTASNTSGNDTFPISITVVNTSSGHLFFTSSGKLVKKF